MMRMKKLLAYALVGTHLFFSYQLLAYSQTTTTNPQVTGVAVSQSNVAISGGTINGTAIGGTTPAAGSFTTLSASGVITPTYPAGIAGNVTGSAPTTGRIGERLSVNSALADVTSSGTAQNAASLSITAGVWLIYASAYFQPAASTVVTSAMAGLSVTSATLPVIPYYFYSAIDTGSALVLAVPQIYVNQSGTNTYYCVVRSFFSVSTIQAQCAIEAVRIG